MRPRAEPISIELHRLVSVRLESRFFLGNPRVSLQINGITGSGAVSLAKSSVQRADNHGVVDFGGEVIDIPDVSKYDSLSIGISDEGLVYNESFGTVAFDRNHVAWRNGTQVVEMAIGKSVLECNLC